MRLTLILLSFSFAVYGSEQSQTRVCLPQVRAVAQPKSVLPTKAEKFIDLKVSFSNWRDELRKFKTTDPEIYKSLDAFLEVEQRKAENLLNRLEHALADSTNFVIVVSESRIATHQPEIFLRNVSSLAPAMKEIRRTSPALYEAIKQKFLIDFEANVINGSLTSMGDIQKSAGDYQTRLPQALREIFPNEKDIRPLLVKLGVEKLPDFTPITHFSSYFLRIPKDLIPVYVRRSSGAISNGSITRLFPNYQVQTEFEDSRLPNGVGTKEYSLMELLEMQAKARSDKHQEFSSPKFNEKAKQAFLKAIKESNLRENFFIEFIDPKIPGTRQFGRMVKRDGNKFQIESISSQDPASFLSIYDIQEGDPIFQSLQISPDAEKAFGERK